MFNKQQLWLTALLTAAVGRALAGSLTAPPTVELNGVCNLFGDRCAILTVNPAAGAPSLILAEGESADGIKLMTVDMAANCVRIENGGQFQSLRLNGAANDPFGAAGNGGKFLARGADGMVGTVGADGLLTEISPGNPGWGTLPPVPAGGGPGAQAGANPGRKAATDSSAVPGPSSVDNAATAATPSATPADNEWYQESLSIEQSRKDNAAQVLAGEQEPWARTPLTPPGTPAALVGPGMFFSNHLPRYVVTGSLNN